MKRSNSHVKSKVSSSVAPDKKARKARDGVTRVGIVTAPIKGKVTQAKQWNRWTP